MEEYPFLSKIQERLDEKDKKIEWLTPQIDRSKSWLYGLKSINEVPVGVVLKISSALEFDFLVDYYKHLGFKTLESQNLLAEPKGVYTKKEDEAMTVQISLRGTPETIGRALESIKKESSKKGYELR